MPQKLPFLRVFSRAAALFAKVRRLFYLSHRDHYSMQFLSHPKPVPVLFFCLFLGSPKVERPLCSLEVSRVAICTGRARLQTVDGVVSRAVSQVGSKRLARFGMLASDGLLF